MRLFFGLTLPPEVRKATAQYARLAAQTLPGRYALPENHHITLAFLGEVEPADFMRVLGKELRKLYTARLAIDNGRDKFYLMEQWGMRSDYPARLLLNVARHMTTQWAADAVCRCRELDLRMKSVTGVDSAAELKLFLMELAQGAKR